MTINFAIDLGTTNSLIARCEGGVVEVFKNPLTLKETLPSVVAFRKDRVVVGDKAREFAQRDPHNVFSSFKRKMGTEEVFRVESLGTNKTPIELSSLVLRELRQFVHSGEKIASVVITIPASFDTIQSNATKKAGYEAGFQEVALLQEPIAASLAFANRTAEADTLTGQWLVYDLGGGTFDVALVRIEDGEMRVIDHEGDNYLGGLDFDNAIIEQLLAPALASRLGVPNLWSEMRRAGSRWNKLYFELLYKAEEAKIQLTNTPTADIELLVEMPEGDTEDVFLSISRDQFERTIQPRIDDTIAMIRHLLEKNGLSADDVRQVVMIGGSTYIPAVRSQVGQALGIQVNCSVDPTTAVAVGAAYYAGSKIARLPEAAASPAQEEGSAAIDTSGLKIKMAYANTSQDLEEYFGAQVEGPFRDFSYRIVRQDGGFDTGVKPLQARISDVLPLLPAALNVFTLRILDQQHQLVNLGLPDIEIRQGKFTIHGQPLPNDICLEVDDSDNGGTRLEVVFEKNSILPLRRTIVRTASKNINKGSSDKLIINVLEGSRFAAPSSCLPIGIIEVSAEVLRMNIVKGADIEIELSISESRDLRISAYLMMTSQEFEDVFSPTTRRIVPAKLQREVADLIYLSGKDLARLQEDERYEDAAIVHTCLRELERIAKRLQNLQDNDLGDEKYQLEERKRRISQQLDAFFSESRAEDVKRDYFQAKRDIEYWLEQEGADHIREPYTSLMTAEKEILASNNRRQIERLTERLYELSWKVKQKNPVYLTQLFYYYAGKPIEDYKNTQSAQQMIKRGEAALGRKNYDELLAVIYGLYNLLPHDTPGAGLANITGLA